jgi:hypothetical protein
MLVVTDASCHQDVDVSKASETRSAASEWGVDAIATAL